MAMPVNCRDQIEQYIGRPLRAYEVEKLDKMHHKSAIWLARSDPDWSMRSQTDRDLLVAEDMGKQLLIEANKRMQQEQLQVTKKAEVDAYVARYLAENPSHTKEDAYARWIAHYADEVSGTTSIDTTAHAVAVGALRKLIVDLHSIGPKLWGVLFNKEGRNALYREAAVLGSSGDPVARRVIEVWREATDALVRRWNAAGGVVGRITSETFMPRRHDILKVSKAVDTEATVAGIKTNKWVADVFPLRKVGDFVREDGTLKTDAEVVATLEDMSRTIKTEGYSKIDPQQPGPSHEGRISSRNHHRQIHFADADAEIRYTEMYGEPNVVANMVSHVWKFARDIAVLEKMGPKAEAMHQYMLRVVTKDLADRGLYGPQVDVRINKLENLWKEAASGPDSLNSRLARAASGMRAFVSSTRLGKIVINSLADQGTMHVIAGLNNIPHMQVVWDQARYLVDKGEMDALAHFGFGLDNLISQLNRMGEQNFGTGIFSRAANFLIGSTGHMRIERATRTAFEAALARALTSEVTKYARLADVPVESGRILRNSGITEATWEVLRAVVPEDVQGSRMITADGIERLSGATLSALAKKYKISKQRLVQDAQDQMIGHLLDQSHRAVVTPKAAELAAIHAGTKAGTWKGETWNSVFLFKSFPISQMHQMYYTASGMQGVGKVKYVAAHVAATTFLGYVSLQIGEMLAGRDPRDSDLSGVEGWRTLMASMLKGGSLGFYGDFLYAPMNRYNQSLFGGLLGPVLGTIEQGIGITQGAATKALIKAMHGEEVDVHWTEDAIRFAKGNVPILGTHWAIKPVLDHLIWHNLQEMASPGYMRRMKYRAQREYGQDFFVDPGEMLPHRAPDFSKMLPYGGK